jgi:hypothetical protein
MVVQIIGICLTIAPVFLLVIGALGAFKIMSVGPVGFPKDHPVNVTLSYIILISALGMFYYRFSPPDSPPSNFGAIITIVCFIAYSVVVARNRKQFPPKSSMQLYSENKLRFDNRKQDWPFKWGKKSKVTKPSDKKKKPTNK